MNSKAPGACRNRHLLYSVFLLALLLFGVGWSGHVHRNMTEISIDRLPQRQREIIAPFREDLIETYCLIPDIERPDPESKYRQYVQSFLDAHELTDIPPQSNIRNLLHAADRAETNVKIYAYYTKTICKKLKEGETKEAMKYLGTFLHFIQDTSCPAHLRYGPFDHPRGEAERIPHFSSLHFFKRFMPVPEKYEDARLHGYIDRAGFDKEMLRSRLGDYKPQSLGENLDAVIDAFQKRHEQMMVQTDRTLIPMLQALFSENEEKFAEYGLDAAEPSVQLAADFMYTILGICADSMSGAGKNSAGLILKD